MADVANSLLAIKRYVFDERQHTIEDLVRILRDDWRHEPLRQRIRREMLCYGNGDPAADAMMKRVFDDCASMRIRRRI